MVLVGGAILPHGALVLDPSRDEMPGPLAASAKALHDACAEAATAIEAARPDLILLYTPHGLITDAADMHVYVNQTASGSCEWMGSWGEHRVSVRCDPDAAHSLVRQLRPSGDERVATLCAFSGYDAPLRWGETVPLAFLHRVTAKPGGEGAKVVILSHGPATTSERCKTAAGRMEATRGMGTRLGIWASERAERVFFVVSGDLSHAHGNGRAPRLANGTPDRRYTNPKYGAAEADAEAAHFERDIVAWIRCVVPPSADAWSDGGTESPTIGSAGELGQQLLYNSALPRMPRALCCGYEGFVLLNEALVASGLSVKGRLLAHEVPVYYGMLVATFLPEAPPPPRASPRRHGPAHREGEGELSKRQRTRGVAAAAGASDDATAAGAAQSADASLGALVHPPPPLSRLDFEGKVALVSGAGHGFGREIALSLASLGATVQACDGPGDAARTALLETRRLAEGLRGSVGVSVVDFRDMAAVEHWVRNPWVLSASPWGFDGAALDLLVLNAGGVLGHVGGPIEEATLESWDAIFDVNARAAFVAARAAAPALKRARGRVVTISSGAALRPSLTGIHAYCAAKHALLGLTKQLALELGEHGVTVNSVAPGFVRSNAASEAQWAALGAAGQAAQLSRTFMRKLGAPADIASAVLFFAAEASSWVTGQVLSVDGGRA